MTEMRAILGDTIDEKRAETCVKRHAFENEGSKQKRQEWLEAALNEYLNELVGADMPVVATCANRPTGANARVTQTSTDIVDLTKDDVTDKGITKEDQDMNKFVYFFFYFYLSIFIFVIGVTRIACELKFIVKSEI